MSKYRGANSDLVYFERMPFRAQVSGVARGPLRRGETVVVAYDYGDTHECNDCGSDHPTTVIFSWQGGGLDISGFAGWDAEDGDDVMAFGDHGLIPPEFKRTMA